VLEGGGELSKFISRAAAAVAGALTPVRGSAYYARLDGMREEEDEAEEEEEEEDASSIITTTIITL
jgi:ribosomal protein L12E/L44/L45/RPP1/RPP2